MKTKYLENKNLKITKAVFYDKSDIKYNTQININYQGKIYKINSRKYYEQYQSIWKCLNYRRTKDIPQNQKIFVMQQLKELEIY